MKRENAVMTGSKLLNKMENYQRINLKNNCNLANTLSNHLKNKEEISLNYLYLLVRLI